MKNLVKSEDVIVYADSAYVGKEGEASSGVEMKICRRAYRNKPLTEDDKKWNKGVAKTRRRIEHIFGFMTNSLHGLFVRSVGIVWAKFNIGLTTLDLQHIPLGNLCKKLMGRKASRAWNFAMRSRKICLV